MPNDLTDEIYWAHQPPEVRALKGVDEVTASQTAYALDQQGFIIDRAIMIWGWDALKMMVLRKSYGFTWVPNAFQPDVSAGPGFAQPGETPYDPATPWPRSIKVSTDAADYPAFDPVVTPPVPVVKPVGAAIGDGKYAANLQAVNDHGRWLFSEGQSYTQDGTKYAFHLMWTMFGPEAYWTLFA